MQSDVSRLGKLQLKEDENITLYSIDGRILTARKFAEQNLGLLSCLEQELIREQTDELLDVEHNLTSPLVRTQEYSNGLEETVARRAGARSAYLPRLRLKIKGCRPEDATFPEWEVDEESYIKINEIPFGVLEAESVMREILAYCFMRRYNLPYSSEPICVFEYQPNGKFMNYGLVSRVSDDRRVEGLIDCSGYTLHDVIRLKRLGKLRPNEAGLEGMDIEEYVKRKSTLLTAFNFRGGFRGILNSNIGNDVVRDEELFCLCDFDTFRVIGLPKGEKSDAIRSFVIHSFLELIKTSLPFIDYLEFGDTDLGTIHRSLSDYYRAHSALYRAYRKEFIEQSRLNGWNSEFVGYCIDEAFKLRASFELLQELIPNSHTLKNFKGDSFYTPHN